MIQETVFGEVFGLLLVLFILVSLTSFLTTRLIVTKNLTPLQEFCDIYLSLLD